MTDSLALTLQIVLALVAGIGAQVLADVLRVPSITFLLLFGIVLGADGLGWLQPQSLGMGLEVVISLCVALILFEGGLNLSLRELGQVSGTIQNLVTVGALITLVGGGVAAHTLGEFPWPLAFLYGSLVTVTGPTVIGPLLRQVKVDRKLGALLEGEGVLIDPVGAILAVVVLNIVLTGDTGWTEIVLGLGTRLGLGIGIGAVGGWLLSWLFRQESVPSQDLKNLAVLAGLWGLYGLAQWVQSESGLMAAAVAGIVLQLAAPEQRLLRRFKGQLTTLAVSLLFILLAADLSLASLGMLGWGGLGTVVVLMGVVRPLNILVSTWNSDLHWRQKLFLAWIAPRGIVSASVASLFSIVLTARGLNGGDSVKGLVFLTIILTVVVPGVTAQGVARLLGVRSEQTNGAVIVGSSPLGRLLARLFQEHGEPVVLIDTNREDCRTAARENLRTIPGSALDPEVLAEAGMANMGTFLALTKNAEVNLVLAQRVAEEFYPPRVLALFQEDQRLNHSQVRCALHPQLVLGEWNQALERGEVRLAETRWGESAQELDSPEVLPLLRQRHEFLEVVTTDMAYQPGDRLIYLAPHAPANGATEPEPVEAGDMVQALLGLG
ncbi:cation:proton antiporter [Gloeomargarita lithophora]|uniref:cation:proton antiporter n=1 Tax=Gloeomargarita lithophora TaxID=1188228 RepID=UPI003F727B78